MIFQKSSINHPKHLESIANLQRRQFAIKRKNKMDCFRIGVCSISNVSFIRGACCTMCNVSKILSLFFGVIMLMVGAFGCAWSSVTHRINGFIWWTWRETQWKIFQDSAEMFLFVICGVKLENVSERKLPNKTKIFSLKTVLLLNLQILTNSDDPTVGGRKDCITHPSRWVFLCFPQVPLHVLHYLQV